MKFELKTKSLQVNKLQDKIFTGAKSSKNDRVGGLQKWLRDDGEQEFADEVKMAYQAEDEKNQKELSANMDDRQTFGARDEKMNKNEMKIEIICIRPISKAFF